jgi:hypothetical protein
MSRIGSTLVGLSAVLVLAIALPAAAYAAPEWFVEGKKLEGTASLAKETKLKGAAVIKDKGFTMECKKVKVLGGIISGKNENTGALSFEECKVTKPVSCEVKTIETKPLSFPLEEPGTVVKLRFKPKSGTTIATFSCGLLGSVELKTATEGGGEKGGMNCEYPNIAEEAKEHLLDFSASSGSEFKIKTALEKEEAGEFLAEFTWWLEGFKLFSVK